MINVEICDIHIKLCVNADEPELLKNVVCNLMRS